MGGIALGLLLAAEFTLVQMLCATQPAPKYQAGRFNVANRRAIRLSGRRRAGPLRPAVRLILAAIGCLLPSRHTSTPQIREAQLPVPQTRGNRTVRIRTKSRNRMAHFRSGHGSDEGGGRWRVGI